MNRLIDCHTHSLKPDAIVNRLPGDALAEGYSYSMGVHPWEADKFNKESLTAAVANTGVVAVGETGLDALRGPAMEVQEKAFEGHIEVARESGMPIIVHCVKAVDRLLAIKRQMWPDGVWIYHGFRGKPQQAMQLIEHGFHISLGPRFNLLSAAVIPAGRLLIETDDSPESITDVAAAVAAARGVTAEEIIRITGDNLAAITQLKLTQ